MGLSGLDRPLNLDGCTPARYREYWPWPGLPRRGSVVCRVRSDEGQDFKAQARSGVLVPGYRLQVVKSAGGPPVEAELSPGLRPGKSFEGRLICRVTPGTAFGRPGT